LGTNNRRPIFPIILMLIGLLILIGVIARLVLFSSPDDLQTVEGPAQDIPFAQIARVDLSVAKAAFDDGTAIFVDVRDQASYENGHIPGALSMPLSQIEAGLDELDPKDRIILYCT
jgi:predicted sulfurtransferase